ncbi:MAG: hypothetical protein IT374_22205 [Polyangiaceae bacterium]|nr:hypothetical protein [Polyangiaceae bacterium]
MPRLRLLLAPLLASSAAFAGDAASAEALFVQGRAAADRGDHATACAKFEESNRLDPAPGTVFNLGDCSEKLGKLATAWQYFREVAQRLPASDERVPIAIARAARLDKRTPRLTIRLAASAPAGTVVARDGSELGAASLGVALPVDPGEHQIEVRAAGRRPATRRVTIAEGAQQSLEVDAGPLADGAVGPAPRPDAAGSSGGRRTAGWIALGAGGVVFGVGVVTGVMVLGKKSTVDANCDADKRCNQAGADAADAGRTLGKVSGVSFVLGAAGLGVGGYLLATSPRRETAIAPWFGPGAGGLSLARRF